MEQLEQLIKKATSPFHTVKAVKERLKEHGFTELSMSDTWELQKGGMYVLEQYGSTLFAWTVGTEYSRGDSLRMAAAHGDFPGFCIKPNPDMEKEGYVLVNTEGYGGAILNSWCDRPLSAAGRVVIKSEDAFRPEVRLVDLRKPVCTIPNVAIHLNREVNKGVELKKQTHMLPIIGQAGEYGGFLTYLAKELGVEKEDILDYELYLYNTDAPKKVGMAEEFYSAPRLDDLTAVSAVTEGLLRGKRERGIHLIAIFDHEEVGSRTKQGAGTQMLSHVLDKIYLSLGLTREDYYAALADGMLLSVDVSQGYHPSYGEKYDPTNHNLLNHGFSIKRAASQSYATDSEAIGIVKQICRENGIPYQDFTNQSDIQGGSTLGAIATAFVPVRTVDIGVPILAMHSARETMGVKDQASMTAFVCAFFSQA